MDLDILRYAVYLAPRPETALARLAADWLGWDAESGQAGPGGVLPGLGVACPEAVAAPRKYGFHATLKAPFRLAQGRDAAGLDAAVAALAAEHAAFALDLRLAALGPFLALVEATPSAPLAALAADCVTRLDGFRAPLGPADLARRRAGGLSAAEDANLVAWGYPYVLDTFQFHLTLTGALDPALRADVEPALAAALAPILAAPLHVADLCVFGEAADGRFHLLRRHPLGAAARRP